MSHKENKSHEEKASGFKKNDLILVLLVFVAAVNTPNHAILTVFFFIS